MNVVSRLSSPFFPLVAVVAFVVPAVAGAASVYEQATTTDNSPWLNDGNGKYYGQVLSPLETITFDTGSTIVYNASNLQTSAYMHVFTVDTGTWKLVSEVCTSGLAIHDTYTDYTGAVLTFNFDTPCTLSLAYKYAVVVSEGSGNDTWCDGGCDWSTRSRNFIGEEGYAGTWATSTIRGWDEDGDPNYVYPVNAVWRLTLGSEYAVSGGYLSLYTPCAGDEGTITSCVTATSSTTTVSGVFSADEPYQVNIKVTSVDGWDTYDSVTYAGDTALLTSFTDDFDVSSTTAYGVTACLERAGVMTWEVAGTRCVTLRVGNGISETQLTSYLNEKGMFVEPPALDTVWSQNGCDDIGITDVKKGVVCAGIFLFYPNRQTLDDFLSAAANVAHIYPIGYGAVIAEEFLNARTATSTIWDKDINVGAWFGVATSTISVDVTSAVTGENTWWQPLVDKVDFFLWAAFVGWLLFWGLTRKL